MGGIIYILKSEDGRLYIGSTTDLKRRLEQHKTGHTWSTQRLKNFKLVFSQEYPDLTQARKIELRLKKLKRKDYLEKIIQDGYLKIKP